MYISTRIHVFSKVGVSDSGNEANLIQKAFLFSFFFFPPSHPPTSFINICEKDCFVGSIMMMEGLAYLVEAGCFFFFFVGSQLQYYVGVCVEKKEKRRSKNRQH